jgi:integrase
VPRSRERYREIADADLACWTNTPIEALDVEQIQRRLIEIVDSGRSAAMAFGLIRCVFKFAHNMPGMLPSGNPCLSVQPPRKRRRSANFLSSSEADMVLAACLKHPTARTGAALERLVRAILGTGLRISEALGLIVADVHVDDLDGAWIDVDMQLERRGKGRFVFRRVPLKSESAQRRVALDRDTAELFAELIEGKRPDQPVFTDPATGGWWCQHKVNFAWAKVRAIACTVGLSKSPRIHDLRHTHAGWLLTDGVSLIAVSRRLGHASIVITADTYGHLLPESDDTVRAAMSARVSRLATTTSAPKGTRRPANRSATNTAPPNRPTTDRTTGRATGTRSKAAEPAA